MEIYLVRHAVAQQLGQKNEFTDEKRALTSQGRERMREIARGLKRLGVVPDLIMTSSLVRAIETGAILAETLGLDQKQIRTSDTLAPGGSFDELFTELKQQKRTESVALVGHEPDLSSLISRIVCAEGNGNLSVPLKKGGVCCINVAETVPAFKGSLIWLLTPKHLRLLGR
jgi:phosphohistidine phosphatase